jgi:hypothetical protein
MSDPFLLMASFGLLLFAAARQLDRELPKARLCCRPLALSAGPQD